MSVLATVICHWSLVIRIEAIGVQRLTIPRSAQPLAASAQIDRYRNFLVSVKNSKLQITNNKQITMTKIPNYKPV
jgi:hypothetical protein